MDKWVQTFVQLVSIIMGSAGLWSVIQNRKHNKNNKDESEVTRNEAIIKMMMSLGYDQIVTRGLGYISRGWISADEFEDFDNLYYRPYKLLGGNGLAEKIRNQVEKLPFTNPQIYFELRPNNRQEYNNDGWQSTTQGFNRSSVEQPKI